VSELFDAGWRILNIELSFNGYTFKAWHPAAFCLLIYIVLRVLLVGANKNE
jgi:hypothetical protein